MAKRRKTKIPQQTSSRSRAPRPNGLDDLLAAADPDAMAWLDSGTYEGYIKPKSGRLELKGQGQGYVAHMDFITVINGEESTQHYFQDLSTQTGVNIFTGHLRVLGFEKPETKDEAADCLKEVDNLAIKFFVGKPRGEFPPNVRILDLIEGEPSSEADSEDAEDQQGPYTKEEVNAMSDEELERECLACGMPQEEFDSLGWDEVRAWLLSNED